MTMAHFDTEDLERSLAGSVIVPGDDVYDVARRCFNAFVDRRPRVIARCRDAADVATAFDFARAHELPVAVRGGGHNPAGHCVLDDGLVIDLSEMRAVEVDADKGIARAEGGATWLDFDSSAQALGLATPGGVVGSTGVAGLTLGGGIGHLTAQFGLTCDNLVGADLVTPDGATVRADQEENADLLWGLRGAGGNFGVATRLEFRLHPVDRVVGGTITYASTGVREGLRRFRDVTARAPRDLSCQAILATDESTAPVLVVAPCYTGADEDPSWLRELRALAGVVADDVSPRSFLDQQRMFDSPYGENRHYWKGHFVRELSDELIDALIEQIVSLGRPPGEVLIESLHGAATDGDVQAGAVGFRGATFNMSAISRWRNPSHDAEQIQWARDTAGVIEQWSFSGGGYVNYMQGDEPIERVRAAFGVERFERLRNLKSRFDPTNVLRRNQNVPPL
jgi:FAD/FMN-containing dehydrogenase